MKDTSGPAFPEASGFGSDNSGLTKREWFAAANFSDFELRQIAYRLHQQEPSIDETHNGDYVVPYAKVAARFAEARRILAEAMVAELNKE